MKKPLDQVCRYDTAPATSRSSVAPIDAQFRDIGFQISGPPLAYDRSNIWEDNAALKSGRLSAIKAAPEPHPRRKRTSISAFAACISSADVRRGGGVNDLSEKRETPAAHRRRGSEPSFILAMRTLPTLAYPAAIFKFFEHHQKIARVRLAQPAQAKLSGSIASSGRGSRSSIDKHVPTRGLVLHAPVMSGKRAVIS